MLAKIFGKSAPFIYASGTVPKGYACKRCSAKGCKLWRPYESWNVVLLCAPCAASDQDKDISTIDADGRWGDDRPYPGRSWAIGWFVPAVPVEEDEISYWGYTSIPQVGIDWWRALSTLPS